MKAKARKPKKTTVPGGLSGISLSYWTPHRQRTKLSLAETQRVSVKEAIMHLTTLENDLEINAKHLVTDWPLISKLNALIEPILRNVVPSPVVISMGAR
jgi:hypothetical protein